jgi:GTP-binding protein
MTYIVAIVGRANVGKSTLFNRLVGRKQAVVSYEPGTTRDFLVEDISWRGKTFTILDTAGIDLSGKDALEKDVLLQSKEAIEGADLIIFLTDARQGIQASDKEAANLIRKLNKPVILASNKIEAEKKVASNLPEFYSLGLGEPMAISAIQGTGVGDLLDEVVKKLPTIKKVGPKSSKKGPGEITRVAILGKPNVGKSTLFNKLIGKNRSLVSQAPGTTRDMVNETIQAGDLTIEFVDTAGLRRRSKIETGPELFSSLRSIRAIKEADIGLLLVDATCGVSQQEKQIVRLLLQEGKSIILVINKWDLIETEKKKVSDWEKEIALNFHFAKHLPQIYVSALTGQRVDKIFNVIKEVDQARKTKLTAKALTRLVQEATMKRPAYAKRKPVKIYYAKQVAAPGIVIQLTTNSTQIDDSYFRFLENLLREKINPLLGTPVKFTIKQDK